MLLHLREDGELVRVHPLLGGRTPLVANRRDHPDHTPGECLGGDHGTDDHAPRVLRLELVEGGHRVVVGGEPHADELGT